MMLLIGSHSRTICHDRIIRNFPAAGFDHRGRRSRGIDHRRDSGHRHIDAPQAAKAPQKVVKYQDTPKGEQRCDNCDLFEAPSSCKNVDGTIAAQGWCIVYRKKQA
jgi:hypothetical protein